MGENKRLVKWQSSDFKSGLPRRSYLTARNDGAGGHHLFQSFELWKRLVKNPVNLENLNKIVVQTKTHALRHCERSEAIQKK